jgi:hypothetical protein
MSGYENLPNEIQDAILRKLDGASLIAMRNVNTTSRALIDGSPNLSRDIMDQRLAATKCLGALNFKVQFAGLDAAFLAKRLKLKLIEILSAWQQRSAWPDLDVSFREAARTIWQSQQLVAQLQDRKLDALIAMARSLALEMYPNVELTTPNIKSPLLYED